MLVGWYDDFLKGLQDYPSKTVELWELVRKLSNCQEASSAHRVEQSEAPSFEVENLRLLLVAKNQELLKSKQKHVELEVANAQLKELLDVANQKNRELIDHAKEVDANAHSATKEHFKVLEHLPQIRTSVEGFRKLSETLEAQLAQFEESREKAEESLVAAIAELIDSKDRCNRFRQGYHFWKAKATRYLKELSFVPWLRDLVWARGFYWGFENYRHLTINQDRYNIDPTTVNFDFRKLPSRAIDELADIGKNLLPNAP